MKKFYATLFILTFAVVSVFSQRHTDIQVTETGPGPSATIKNGVALTLSVKVKNLGPSVLKKIDSLLFVPTQDNNNFYNGSNLLFFLSILSADLPVGSETSLTLSTNLGFVVTLNGAHQFCFEGIILNRSADSTVDDNINNNKGCQTVYLDPYKAGITTGGITVSSADVFPNPAGNSTSVSYSVATPSIVSIKIKDINGKEVLNVSKGYHEAGEYSEQINTSSLSPGIYFTEVQIGESVMNKKLMIVR